jgi:hypothetical protein
MSRVHAHKPHLPDNDVPDEFEPGAPPVEPDQGPMPPAIPDDPEHDRTIDPAIKPGLQTRPSRSPVEEAACP